MSLKGKTLFITGASRGIGLAIALRAARDGANIAIAAKTAAPDPRLPGTIFTAAEDVEKAGFVRKRSADFLRNPEDTRDWNASPVAAGEKRGESDRFVLEFVKPAS